MAPGSGQPFYLKGLILPGERESVEPTGARVAPGDTRQLHHFVSISPWAAGPLEEELVKAGDRLVGGPDAALVVRRHRAGVIPLSRRPWRPRSPPAAPGPRPAR